LSRLTSSPKLPPMVAHVKQLEARSVAHIRALQVLGAGMLSGVLGGVASHKLWMGICFAAGGVLVTLSAIDYRCAALGSPYGKVGDEEERLNPPS
jgi:hypothetical protein